MRQGFVHSKHKTCGFIPTKVDFSKNILWHEFHQIQRQKVDLVGKKTKNMLKKY